MRGQSASSRTSSNRRNDRKTKQIVEAIVPLPRDPNIRRIMVDGRVAATLRSGLIESLALTEGASWSRSMQNRVQRAIDVDAAHRKLMALLSKRALSKAQARGHLLRAHHRASIVDEVIEHALQQGWMNDEALAVSAVRNASRRRPAGRKLIAAQLQRAGISDERAVEPMSSLSPGQQRDAAWTLARQRLATMGSIKPSVAIRRIAGQLASRGFEDDIVEETIDRLKSLASMPDDDHL